ncbi:hypothetical protein [Mucilaginibacter lacusdianchii]|uniref:hypothetical protein n=1 Tax=Mucilaginibacter lacusdianchii TaxID=2684211 RepID=UPI00131E2D80|nr:hypothetical protein [Mucilaginibacter sp. JXJ CY 39]
MKRLIPLLLLLTTAYHANAQQQSLPAWFTRAFKQHKLDEKYELKAYLKPAYLEADFNGDGIKDIIALIAEKKTHKRGLVLVHAGTGRFFVFGAGTAFGDTQGDDDYKWSQGWAVYKRKLAYEMLFDSDSYMSGSCKV